MPGFVLNMKGVGQPVAEYDSYPVVLTKIEAKKNAKGDDQVSISATINGSGTEFDGRTLIRNFTFPTKSDPQKDTSGLRYYLQSALKAFGADEDEVTDEETDIIAVGVSLYGNRALAKVVHDVNMSDPKKPPFVNVTFRPSDDD